MTHLTEILRQGELGREGNWDDDNRRAIAKGVRFYLTTEPAITTYEIRRSVEDILEERDFPRSAIPASYWKRGNNYLKDSGDLRWSNVRTAALKIVRTRYPEGTKIVIGERPDEHGSIFSLVLYKDEEPQDILLLQEDHT